MPTHAEIRRLPYSVAEMYALVADLAAYPEFLPWCSGARVLSRTPQLGGAEIVEADLMIGFKMVRERFTSRVTLSAPDRIDVAYLDGPFRYLNNHWVFKPTGDGCVIDFYIDFEFHSRILQRLMGPLFNEAVRRMVSAFESRARALYGADPEGAKATAI